MSSISDAMVSQAVFLFSIILGLGVIKAELDYSQVAASLKFFIYTQENPTDPERILPDVESIIRSPFNALKPTMITIHRWEGSYSSMENNIAVPVKLAQEDCNVLVVDWSEVPFQNYEEAVMNAAHLAKAIERMIVELVMQFDVSLDSIHVMGFDFGANLAGLVGQIISEDFSGSKIQRITALDPLREGFDDFANILSSRDANFVEVIHTNAGYLGVSDPLGHIDFYPNGGQKQPGCNKADDLCSHERAYELLPEMWSRNCNDFISAKCSSVDSLHSSSCRWMNVKMGQFTDQNGIFYLETSYAYPYGKGSYIIDFY